MVEREKGHAKLPWSPRGSKVLTVISSLQRKHLLLLLLLFSFVFVYMCVIWVALQDDQDQDDQWGQLKSTMSDMRHVEFSLQRKVKQSHMHTTPSAWQRWMKEIWSAEVGQTLSCPRTSCFPPPPTHANSHSEKLQLSSHKCKDWIGKV